MNGKYCVYKLTAPNGKIYIGVTSKRPEERWRGGRGYRQNKQFTNDILKYGWRNIQREIVYDNLDKESAYKKEIELISLYDCTSEEKGYNKAIGGLTNRGFHYHWTKEQRKAMSKKMMGNQNFGRQDGEHNSFYGHHHSDEAKRKISQSQYNPVLQYDKSGAFIAEYANPYQAELQTGILHIQEVCKGKRKSVGGYVWRFKLGLWNTEW